MRLDLQNQQGKRTDLEEDAQKIDTLGETGKEHKDSRRTVAYLIRLTFLIPGLLLLVDDGKIGFKVGVNISYLTSETQEYLLRTIIPTGIKLKSSQISELRPTGRMQSAESGHDPKSLSANTKDLPGLDNDQR